MLVMSFSALVIGIYAYISVGRIRIIGAIRSNYRNLIFVGCISATLNMLNFFGLTYSSAVNSAIISRLDVLFAAFLGGIMFGERLRRTDWVAVFFMIPAVMLVLKIDFSDIFINPGDILFIVSTFLLALNAQNIKYRLSDVPQTIIIVCNAGICTIVYFTASLILGERNLIIFFKPYTAAMLLCGLLLATQFVAYYNGLKQLPTWLARAYFLAVPVAGAISSLFILKVAIYPGQVYGMLLVGLGVIIISYKQNTALIPEEIHKP
jgi:drug/metabolite transporter (DMT)-like permease